MSKTSQSTNNESDVCKSIPFVGVVTEVNKGCNFIVQTEEGHTILATLGGKMRINKIRLLVGDKVRCECSPYDLSRGRVVSRL